MFFHAICGHEILGCHFTTFLLRSSTGHTIISNFCQTWARHVADFQRFATSLNSTRESEAEIPFLSSSQTSDVLVNV